MIRFLQNYWDGCLPGQFEMLMTQYLSYFGLAVCLILGIWLIFKVLAAPIKGILKFVLHVFLGLLILFAVNLVGGFFDLYIPFTWLSVLVAGIGGVPGVILLLLIHLLF